MSTTSAKLSAYSAALVLVAGGAWALGTAAGPFPQAEAHGDTHGDTHSEAVVDLPGGLASAQDGYALTPATTTLTPGAATRFTFRITGPDGAPVTAFDVEHEKRLHFIVVRRDTAGYQHLHPDLGADGTWTVPLTVADAGSYRAFADFTPSGAKPLTLGVDLVAPGVFQPVELPETRVADVDGYHVRLDGDLVAGRASRLTATVTEDGRQATDLQPYLGAAGHLVALRGGDLAYLHVHPAGPGLTFVAEVPSAGTYRLFLDFRHGDVVRTAAFTVTTGKGAPR
ncbi:hypothetical protein [Amycolatopsis sp. NBC_01286]|uniref:hypothetical protein n=1 Tax=Amycolatopsis sp. NBC_01286 TaxID=2903560 RepID=UPI002E111315|nr:hypothetical protein OG570_28245 [Amycolatopsis sp. NBC_01286]